METDRVESSHLNETIPTNMDLNRNIPGCICARCFDMPWCCLVNSSMKRETKEDADWRKYGRIKGAQKNLELG